jgi:hypothetical protein
MTSPSYQQAHHATRLAALTELDGVRLPGQFQHAVSVYQEAMAIQPPALPEPGAIGRATTTAALALVRHALDAKQPGVLPPLDTGPIAAARQGERDALDQAALVEQVQAAACALLAEAGRENLEQIIKALQDRHAQVMGDLCQRASRLPSGVNDQGALEAGGQVRVDYLACQGLVAAAGQLREALADVDTSATTVPDDLERCVSYVRSGYIYRNGWLSRAGETTHGPFGSLPFYLGYAQEVPPGDWWLPTLVQAQAQAAALAQQWREQRVKAQMQGVR